MSFKASSGASTAIAVALALVFASDARAYTLSEAATPAENPPASYTQDVYVDSRGCIYVRASIGTTVNWVPRLSRDRETVVCGLSPTGTGAASASVAPAEPAPETPAAPVVSAAPEPAPLAQAPTPAEAPLSSPFEAAREGLTEAVPPAAPVSDGQPQGIDAATPPVLETATRAPVPSAAAPAAPVSRTMDVTCPKPGGVFRVQVGGDTVQLRCPDGLKRTTSYLVKHGDGSRSRVVAHAASGTGLGSLTANAGPAPTPLRAASVKARPGIVAATDTSLAAVSGARWVQVGAFGVQSNATRAIAELEGLGYGAATSRTRSGLTVVLAGPFNDPTALTHALRSLRGYYPDAYTRG